MDSASRRVLVLNFDPILHSQGGRPLHQALEWNDPRRLAEEYAADLAECSAGHARFQVADWLDVDAFPVKTDGFRYDESSYLQCWRNSDGWHQPDQADYDALLTGFDLLKRIDSGDIDEIWVFGPAFSGLWESVMVGPETFWCNAPPLTRRDVSRRFVVMGFSYQRGVGEMLESFGHRVEAILQHTWRNQRGTDNLWEQFTLFDKVAPGKANCGSMHYAPNSMTDYDWGNRIPVPSNCDDWLNFPNFQGIVRQVDCREWGDGDQRAHHLWWLRHLPHAVGETRGVANNWWFHAVAGFDATTEPAPASLPGDVDSLLALLAQNAPPSGLRRLLQGSERRQRAKMRQDIAAALGESGDMRAVDALIELLQDTETEVRSEAAHTLGQIGDKRAMDALDKVAAADDNVQVRRVAEAALNRIDPMPRVGHVFADQYEILQEMEPGGLTAGYRARDIRLERTVVLQVVKEPPASPTFLAAFQREADAFAQLQHPNLVRVLGYNITWPRPFYDREPVGDERTLRDLLSERGRLSLTQVLPILGQVANALDYLHAQDPPVFHLHLKPDHVLLAGEGEAWHAVLTDAIPSRVWQSSQTAALVGTPGYLSPEMAKGTLDAIGPRTDVYGLGLIAYEILTGRAPFEGYTPLAVVQAHAEEPPPPPQQFAPDLSEAVSAVLLKALAKSPEERFASAGAFVAELQEAANASMPASGDVGDAQPVQWQEVQEGLRGQPVEQVSFGDYTVTIGATQGGVVNVAPPGEADRIRPRSEPPHILPRPVAGFLDREEQLRLLDSAVTGGLLADLNGADGVGKTALISRIMHAQPPSRFPDGMVYLSARHDTLEDILQELVEAFYQTSGTIKLAADSFQQYMSDKRALIVLDDLDHLQTAEAKSLIDDLPHCTVLTSSRQQREWGIVHVTLYGLPPSHAIELFEQHWGQVAAQDRPTVEAICAALDGVPLAIIKVARTAAARGTPLEQILALVQPRAGEHEPLGQATRFFAPQLSAEDQRTMAALASSAGSAASLDALATIADMPPGKIAASLARLQQTGLVTIDDARYSVDEGFRPYIQDAWADKEMQVRAADYVYQPLTLGSRIPRPPIEDLVDRLPRHPSKRYGTRDLAGIDLIIIHASTMSADIGPERLAQYNVGQQDWPGVAYHFMIGADGTIYQGNRLETESFHAANLNARSVGVCFLGIFDESVPTPDQLRAGGRLVAWLMQELNIPLDGVKGHKELANTNDPGKQWLEGQKWKEMLLREIEAASGAVAPPALPARFLDLEINIYRTRAPAETAASLSTPLGKAEAVIPLDLDAPELIRGLELLRRGFAPETDFESLGRWLFDHLLAGSMVHLWAVSIAAAHDQGAGIRLLLQIEQPELAALPWELLHDGQAFLALRPDVTFVRHTLLPALPRPLEISAPLRILAVSSSPADMPTLDLEASQRALQEALAGLLASGQATLTVLQNTTVEALADALRQGYHVFHFDGHGSFDQQSQSGYLLLEDESGRAAPLSPQQIGLFLRGGSLQLVVLNTGESAVGGRDSDHLSLAQTLARTGVPAVVAMQLNISDAAAIAFSRDFYAALAAGYPLDVAVAEGRRAIAVTIPSEQAAALWAAPVLLSRTPLPTFQPAPRFWFVTANPEQYDWNVAFEKGSEQWTEVLGAEAQQNLRQARPGDCVLAYRSTPDRYITGLGHIAAQPYEYQDRYAVQIDMDRRFGTGVSLDELKQAAPDLQHVTRPRPLSFSPVTAEQWAIIRELIRFHNPDLPPDELPPITVPQRHGLTIDKVDMPAECTAGEAVQVTLHLRNQGNLTWQEGEQLDIAGHWWREGEGDKSPARIWDRVQTISQAVPPGGALELAGIEGGQAEDEALVEAGHYEVYWNVWGLDWEPAGDNIGPMAITLVEVFTPPPYVKIVERLSPPSQNALLWAEGLRQQLGTPQLFSEYLLAGLYQEAEGLTRRLLTLFDDETTIDSLLQNLVSAADMPLADVQPAAQDALRRLPLSENADKALAQAAALADEKSSTAISSQHLLAGLLAVPESVDSYMIAEQLDVERELFYQQDAPESVAGQWIVEQLQVERETLYQLIADATEQEPPFLDIWWASARRVTVLTGHTGAVTSLAFNLEGMMLTSSSEDTTVRTWNLLRGTALGSPARYRSAVRSVIVTADGARRIMAMADGSLTEMSLDGDTTTIIPAVGGEVIQVAEGAAPPALALSPDGQWLATAWPGGALSARNLSTGRQMELVRSLPGPVAALAVSPGASYLATASSGPAVSVWSSPGGTELFQLLGHQGRVNALAFTPDGTRLVSASDDRTLRVWDVHSGQGLFTLRGHEGAVRAVVVTLNGQWAVSGADDRTLRIWDLATEWPLITQRGQEGAVTALTLSPDGRGLASGDAVGTIRLWDMAQIIASMPQPISLEEALTHIDLVVGDLTEYPLDALVHPTSTDLGFRGKLGRQIRERLGDEQYSALKRQPAPAVGQAIESGGGSLPVRYVIHTPIQGAGETASIATVSSATRAALNRAEELETIRQVGCPALGTGVAGLDPAATAAAVLKTVADHVALGSRLERITFVFTETDTYRAYIAAYRAMGGRFQPPDWLPRLSASSRGALAWAEALRQSLGADAVSSLHLLWGLYQKPGGSARELLAVIAELHAVDEEQIAGALRQAAGAPENAENQLHLSDEMLDQVVLAPDCRQAIHAAADLAGAAPVIRERQVLAGLLAVPDSEAARWLAETIGLPAEQLYQIVAVRAKEEPAESLAEQVRRATEQVVEVQAVPYYAWLEGQPQAGLSIGQAFTLTLSLAPTEQPGSQKLLVPENVLEVTVYVQAPRFHLEGDHPLTLPIVGDGRASRLPLMLAPLSSGEQQVRLLIYPGRRLAGITPAELSATLRVEAPVALPKIPELIDRRAIPDPRPDVMLYLALEEAPIAPGGQQVQVYVTCPALGMYQVPQQPALALAEEDLAALRQAAVQAAAEASDAPGPDLLAGLRAFGAGLFDRLMPEGHPLRSLYWQRIYPLAQTSEQIWSWLVVSDEQAVLPWEMVCPYYPLPGGEVWHDDFLGDKFVLAHWVGRKGLRLAGEAPLGKLDLSHYGQRQDDELRRWQAILGGDDVVAIEYGSGHLALAEPGSPYYGLHVLRYTDPGEQAGLITADGRLAPGLAREQGEAMVHDQRLDFTLRRPVVGLSFVAGRAWPADGPAGTDRTLPLAELDTGLDTSWVVPLMSARATALLGPRWPVPPEIDRLFYQTFYQQIRAGLSLGWAAWYARQQVRAAYPHRADWLAYAYFGHPWCLPYLVRPTRGYTLFEAIDHPEDTPFLASESYQFRASYRTEAPAWYSGRLRVQQAPLEGQDLSVIVVPLGDAKPEVYALEPVPGGTDFQHTLSLTMPDEETTLSVMVRFQQEDEELRTMIVDLDVQAK